MTARWPGLVRSLVFRLVVLGSWVLVASAVAAPVLEVHHSRFAQPLYGFLSHFCHQRPSRSWFLLGSNLGLCARAFSLYATVALAGAWVLASGGVHRALSRLPYWGAAAVIAPLAIDGVGQLIGLWPSINPARGATGLLAGIGLVRLLLPAVERRRPEWLVITPALRRAVAGATLLALLAPGAALAQAGRAKLAAGTPVFLVFPDVVTSETATEGQVVALRVTRDVKVGDAVVIASGARATAKVTSVRRPAGWGTPGTLTVYVSEVETVDGQNVPLAATQQGRGEDKQTTAAVTGIIAGVLCLPSALWGFAIKGDEGRIAPGSEVKAYTEVDAQVALRGQRPVAQ